VRLTGRRDGSTAVDYTVNATSGFAAVTGPATQAGPVNHVLPAWDIATGLYLAVGILAAERRRNATGEGTRLTVALEDVALATAGNLGYLAEAQLRADARGRIGNQVYGDFGRDFATEDGAHVMVLVLTARHWRDLVAATGTGEVVAALERSLGVDFTVACARFRHRGLLGGLFEPWFAAREADAVEAALAPTSVLWSRYRDFADLVLQEAAHPLMDTVTQPAIGSYLAPGSPLVFDAEQTPAVPAPRLGAHTDEVLTDLLSCPPGRIADLRARGVIGA
jgi:2-methylfumaryl-CoA isomerase